MALSAILRLMGLFLRSVGIPLEEIDEISGLYAGRRVLPTVADYAQKPPEFRLDVGGWSDKNSATRNAMPNLYSAARLQTQVARKRELLVTANLALGNYMKLENACLHPSWDMLFEVWPKQNDIEIALQRAESSVNALPAIEDQCGVGSDNEFWNDLIKEVELARDSDDVFTEPSEASEDDMEPAAEDEVFPANVANIEWQLATGKHGRFHLMCSHGLSCGRELRRPIDGRGLAQALALDHVWSPRCWSALPTSVQQWWSDSDKTE